MFSPPQGYLLVGWPRTGTSLLAEALTSTRRLGRVHEYFWRLVEPMHAEELALPTPSDETYAPYLEAALQHGTTENGVFGAKLFWAHAVDLVRRTALIPDFAHLNSLERLWAPFGGDLRLVFIRRNCLRSALSLWRAEVSGEWGRRPDALAAQPPPALDVFRISELHADIHAADIGWQSVLRASTPPVLELAYDDIVADLSAAVSAIAEFVDVNARPDVDLVPTYVRQADDVTDRLEADWVKATGGCERCRVQTAGCGK
jgi:LPS sulfotransferase NodH